MRRKHLRTAIAGCTLAAAAIATQAQAPAGVTLTGLVDMSIGSTRPPGGTSAKNLDSGKMTTSWIGVRGSEDLGDAFTAVFALESFLRADNGAAGRFDGDAFWARNAFVGLSHQRFGTLRLGRISTPLFVQTLVFNAFGDSFGYSPSIRQYFTSGTVTGDTAWSDAVLYVARPWTGVALNLITAAAEGSNGRNWGGSAGWSGGPAAVGFAFQDVKKDGAAPLDDTRTWQLAGSYDLGRAKLFAQLGDVENRSSGNSFELLSLGATVKVVETGSVLLQWGRIEPQTGARRNTVSAGYDHFLSKRTDAYAVVMHDKIEGLSSGRAFSVGVRHRF